MIADEHEPGGLQFANYRIDRAKGILYRDGKPVALPHKAFQLLCLLAANAGRLVSKESIFAAVWNGEIVEESNLSQTVYLLRKLLGEGAKENRYIATVPGQGYRFVAECAREASEWLDRQSSLPVPANRLVGRAEELAQLLHLFTGGETRLVTLHGPGGIGKTRLALELAHVAQGRFAGGARFVELADVQRADAIGKAIQAAVYGIETSPSSDAMREFDGLAVLDNLEHLPDAGPVIGELLARCPKVRIAATSRTLLRIRGEQAFPVAELELARAVELFAERCRKSSPGFVLSAENATTVEAICRRLEGIPLALELAAPRIRLLPPEAILQRLEDRLGFLKHGPKDLPSRQRTLRQTIGWSYEQLEARERIAFRRLAVFAGGCTLEAAAALLEMQGTEPEDAILSLMEQSMLRAATIGDSVRVRMLETLREFAAGQWSADERRDLPLAHARYFTEMLEKQGTGLSRSARSSEFSVLAAESANVEAAGQWLVEGHDAELALRFGAVAGKYWELRGHVAEGRRLLDRILQIKGTDRLLALRGRVLQGAGILADAEGEFAAARLHLGEHLAIARQSGSSAAVGTALNNLGIIALRQGDHAEARRLYEESLDLLRGAGRAPVLAWSLNNLGQLCLTMGDLEAAYRHITESLVLSRELGDTDGEATARRKLGDIAAEMGRSEDAEAHYSASRDQFRNLDRPWGAVAAQLALARLALKSGDSATAEEFYIEALADSALLEDPRMIAQCLDGLADIRHRQKRHWEAAQLLGAKGGGQDTPLAAAIREQIGSSAWDTAFAEGTRMQSQEFVSVSKNGPV